MANKNNKGANNNNSSYKGGKNMRQKKDHKGKPSNNRGNYDGRGRRNFRDGTDPKIPGNAVNDISWYSRHPVLLDAVSRIPFPNRPGMKYNGGTLSANPDAWGEELPLTGILPGVCALEFAYSIGFSDDVTSPASIAAKELYGRIRSKFSGSLDEDAPDLFMYCMALDQIHAYIAFLKRIYGCINVYTSQNRDYPGTILGAMGFTYNQIDTLVRDKNNLWNYINTLVHMVNKFSVPDNMDIYDRHRWMNENIYLDDQHMATQSYLFMPTMFYSVYENSSVGTTLISNQWYPDTVSNMYSFGKRMIEALSNWDDSYTINGHIERAFEGETFYKAELMPIDYVVTPQFVPMVLAQIENFTGLGSVKDLTISQEPESNAIIHKPIITTKNSYSIDKSFINLHSFDPTAEMVVEATRLSAYVDVDGYVHAGTEIPLRCFFYRGAEKSNSNPTAEEFKYIQDYNITWTDAASSMSVLDPVVRRFAFHHAPMGWLVCHKGPEGGLTKGYILGDICNITFITHEQLDDITRVCIYSLFDCFHS